MQGKYSKQMDDLILSIKSQINELNEKIKELEKEKELDINDTYLLYLELIENHNRIIHVYGPQVSYNSLDNCSTQVNLSFITEYPIFTKEVFERASMKDWSLVLYHEEDDGKISKIAYQFINGSYRKIQEIADVYDNQLVFKEGANFYGDEEDLKCTNPYYNDKDAVEVEYEECDPGFNKPCDNSCCSNECSNGENSFSEDDELFRYKELFKKWKAHVDELVGTENGNKTNIKTSREETEKKEDLPSN